MRGRRLIVALIGMVLAFGVGYRAQAGGLVLVDLWPEWQTRLGLGDVGEGLTAILEALGLYDGDDRQVGGGPLQAEPLPNPNPGAPFPTPLPTPDAPDPAGCLCTPQQTGSGWPTPQSIECTYKCNPTKCSGLEGRKFYPLASSGCGPALPGRMAYEDEDQDGEKLLQQIVERDPRPVGPASEFPPAGTPPFHPDPAECEEDGATPCPNGKMRGRNCACILGDEHPSAPN